MQDGQKAVWSFPYVSVAFFPSLKQNFIAYHSSKMSSHPDCIFKIHQLWQSGFSAIDWPSTKPSIKRCTCVNKQKNNRSRWTLNNNITRAQTVWVCWGQDAELRTSSRQRALGPQWPMVEQVSQDEEEVLLWLKEELWVKITVCRCLQLISNTQPTSSFQEQSVRDYIFIKCVRSFIEVHPYCWLCSAYICSCIMWLYNISRVYSNSCCNCSFEPKIIKIGQSFS